MADDRQGFFGRRVVKYAILVMVLRNQRLVKFSVPEIDIMTRIELFCCANAIQFISNIIPTLEYEGPVTNAYCVRVRIQGRS